jgi:hypothetical protein
MRAPANGWPNAWACWVTWHAKFQTKFRHCSNLSQAKKTQKDLEMKVFATTIGKTPWASRSASSIAE